MSANQIKGNVKTELIEFRGGLVAPVDAVRLLWALEDRGIRCQTAGSTLRVTGPNGTTPELTDEEITTIKARKPHLLALVAYQAPPLP